MNDGNRAPRRARPARRRPARLAATVVAAAVLTLPLAACNGGDPAASASGRSSPDSGDAPSAGASTRSPSAVAYSACMRSHGVPTFPDPDSSGQLPKGDARRFGVSDSRLEAARQACRQLLPNYGGTIDADSIQQCMMAADCPAPLVQQVLSEERNFARCMRSHGVPNWPDPSIDSEGRPVFAISIGKDGFNPYSPQIWHQGNKCSYLMPNLPGLPAAVSP